MVKLVQSILGVVSTLYIVGGQLLLVLREPVPNNLADLSVRKVISSDEKAFTGCIGKLYRSDMAKGQVAYVHPKKEGRPGVGYRGLVVASDEVANTLVGRVERVEVVKVVPDRPEHKGWAYGGEIECGVFLLDKVPSGTFGESFACCVNS
jgi:hypothetical protein